MGGHEPAAGRLHTTFEQRFTLLGPVRIQLCSRAPSPPLSEGRSPASRWYLPKIWRLNEQLVSRTHLDKIEIRRNN